MAALNPTDLATLQGHVSTLQTTKAALTDHLSALAPSFAEGEMRVVGPAVQVLVKREGALKIETLPAATE